MLQVLLSVALWVLATGSPTTNEARGSLGRVQLVKRQALQGNRGSQNETSAPYGSSGSDNSGIKDQAHQLVEQLRIELHPIEQQIRNQPYLSALERGEVSRNNLRAFAGEQYNINQKDILSGAMMLSRFGADPASRKFFQDNVASETTALSLIIIFAKALGMTEQDLKAYEPCALAQAYPSYVASITLHESEAAVAAAFMLNFPVFGENAGRMGAALRSKYGLSKNSTAFFTFFSNLPSNFESDALAVIESGLARGVNVSLIRRTVRLLQAYELLFWQAVASDLNASCAPANPSSTPAPTTTYH